MKFWKITLVVASLVLTSSANAAMVLVSFTQDNDGINLDGSEQLDSIIGIDVTHLNRVDWLFDADGDPLNGVQLLNPQTSGGLTITGVEFKEIPDFTEALAGTWNWDDSFGTLDYLSFKFGSWLAVYQITGGETSGAWDLDILCQTDDYCSDDGPTAALSHAAGYSVVPVPAAVWLFGSGLIGLAGLARRKA